MSRLSRQRGARLEGQKICLLALGETVAMCTALLLGMGGEDKDGVDDDDDSRGI